MTFEINYRPAGSGEACAAILAALPDWFGQPDSNASYARTAEDGPAWLIHDDGEPCAILILKTHFETAVEIELLGVLPRRHRAGMGAALINEALAFARERGARYLTVKTLGPSEDYEPYARTRAFYESMGFVALEEFHEIWGPGNPTLFLVRPV